MERRIDEILGGARDAGKTVLTPYLCAGYPDNEALEPMLGACEHAGCPLAILGVPHALAIVEGASLAAAMGQVLIRGVKLEALFEQVRRARAIGAISSRFALVASVSASMLMRDPAAGPGAFMRRAKTAGFDAVLAIDVPLEEAGACRAAADEAGVQFPMLVSAATPQARLGEIAKVATGFVLLVIRAPGTQPSELAGTVARLRGVTPLPILVRMHAATPSHVRGATEHADGVVIAGALARRVSNAGGKQAGEAAGEFLRELAPGLVPAKPTGGAA